MTPQEFETAINAATTVEELRTAVDAFVPVFAKLKNSEKNKWRLIWTKRKEALGVTV